MKKYDFVTLRNLQPDYVLKKLGIGMKGVILNLKDKTAGVMFFNKKNIGDYCVVEILQEDLKLEQETLPIALQSEIMKKVDLNKQAFSEIEIKQYAKIMLMVEKEKYSKYGIHKNAIGVVMEDYSIKNNVLVDFSCIDSKGAYCGDCIEVSLEDIKVIK